MLNEFDLHVAKEIHAMDPPFYSLIAAAVMKADSENLRLLSRAYPDICTAVLGDTWYSVVYEVLRPVIVGCACAPEQGLMCLHHYTIAEAEAEPEPPGPHDHSQCVPGAVCKAGKGPDA